MNSPILPVGGPSGPPSSGPAATGPGDIDDFLHELHAGARVLSIASGRGGPPADVSAQISAAGAIERRLRERGRRVSFEPGLDGRMRMEIHDDATGMQRTLSLAEACELAAGARLG